MKRQEEQVGWITVNEVPTCVKTWGAWIEDSIEHDSIILCVPATPGVTHFYDKFLETLYQQLKIPVWVIGHAGMQIPPASKKLVVPSLRDHPHLYSLYGQIEHKKQFIYKYIPKELYIHLIGHSIGAKICIELMKDEKIASRIKQIHLLFPAIQQLADTPKGWQFTRIWSRMAPFFILIAHLFTLLPYYIRYLLIRITLALRTFIFKVEPCYVNAVLELCNPESTRCVFFLGETSMISVRDLDNDIITKYQQRIRAYFSVSDNWVPITHYETLCKQHPYIKSLLLEPCYHHDFIVNTSVQMANKISYEFKTFTKI